MWLFFTDCMVSVVQLPNGNLVVRGRIKGDVERFLPGSPVQETPHRDYRWRTTATHHEVAAAITRRALTVNYGNFKGAVRDHARHDAYFDVWASMHRAQNRDVAGRTRTTDPMLPLEDVDYTPAPSRRARRK